MPSSRKAGAPASRGSCCDGTTTIRLPPAGMIGATWIAGDCRPPPLPTPPVGGCTFVESPARAATQANILWTAAVDFDVLTVVARPAPVGCAGFNLTDWAGRAAVVECGGREHVMLRHGGGLLRLDVLAGTVLGGPAALSLCLAGPADLEMKLPMLRTLCAVYALGPNARRYEPDRHIDRLITALRVLDARADGASLRDIAVGLRGPHVLADWPGDGESIKSWVRRLVALSEALREAGPRGVLAGAI